MPFVGWLVGVPDYLKVVCCTAFPQHGYQKFSFNRGASSQDVTILGLESGAISHSLICRLWHYECK